MGELERRLEAALTPRAFGEGGTKDETSPSLPGEAEEAAYLAEANGRDREAAPAATPGEETGAQADMPALDDLVGRIPADVRATLDDLFRARFTGVKRASGKDLGSQTS